jgi:dihydrofolate synthase/folylpolyglutamate synthase
MLPDHRDSLDYLYSLRFFGIKLGLDNVRRLLDRVGNPHAGLRIIHLAGTNGKGSTAAALASIFHVAGIAAGLYTSPHLHQFTERIRIATEQLAMDEAVALIEEVRPHAEALQATFFEVTTVMALLSFRRHGLEWAILECGMGGRLDATNVVTPELCLITPIALDHTRHLGATLDLVAAEKAGIIKPGVTVISARQNTAAEAVLRQRCAQLHSPLLLADHDYHWQSQTDRFSLCAPGVELAEVQPGLPGRHQHQNLALAATAAGWLRQRGLPVTDAQLRSALERVCWPGRLEWLPQRILLDGAHNPAGAEILADYLAEQKFAEVHLVFGCKADKEVAAMLRLLLPHCQALYATCPPLDESADPAALAALGRSAGVPSQACGTPLAALNLALSARSAHGVILVAGSLFLVAAVREARVASCATTAICR